MKSTKLILFIILTPSSLLAQESKRVQIIMNTFTSITLPNTKKEHITKGFKILKEIEDSLSSYKPKALLYQLNKYKKVQANTYLLEAIQKSKQFYQQSNGFFNIAIGSVTKNLYHFGEEEEIPTQKSLAKANININNIHITNNFITLEKDTTLDLGGMGKGFAVDKVANYYREQNISHGIITLSGDIQALHPTTLYLQSPFDNTTFAKLKTLEPNISISTSGTYRRYIKNKKYHHLINPKTKKQGQSFVSISLITKQNNTLIDAMATAIGVMPKKEALSFLLHNPHIGYILVRPNGNILYGNLEKFIKLSWL